MEHFRPVHVIQRDTELATALRAHDAEALRVLSADHGGPVFAVANTVARDVQQASDIAVAVFVEAWHDTAEFEPGRDFAPWLMSILRRVADREVEHAGLGPDELVWAARSAIDSLDDAGRDVARLQHLEHLDHAEIANRMRMEPDAVEAHAELAERRLAIHVAAVDGRDDATLAALLADEAFWAQPPEDLPSRIVAAVAPGVPGDVVAGPHGERVAASSGVVTGGLGAVWRAPWLRPALFGAVAAVVVLFGGIVLLSALSGTTERESITVELTPTGLILDVEGDVEVISRVTGLEIVLDAPTLPPRIDGTFYQAWVTTVGGELVPVGTFRRGGRITMSAGIDLDSAAAFLITLEEPAPGDGGGQASSGEVVLRGSLG